MVQLPRLRSDHERLPTLSIGKARDPISLPNTLTKERSRAILSHKSKWANGTILHYFFHETQDHTWPENQKEAVRRAFRTWKDIGIGLSFAEVADVSEAEVRIGFDSTDGSWSWIGTDILRNDDRGRNMNLALDLTTEWGRATALHEIGHLLGLDQGHLNPKAGIEWNEENVVTLFSAPPNSWDRGTIQRNILRKLSPFEVEDRDWDPYSIMHYPIAPNLIRRPERWRGGTPENFELSDSDIAWVREFYPPLGDEVPIRVLDTQQVIANAGSQSNFLFEPEATREYTVKLLGQSDAKIVAFVERSGEWRHFIAGDNSGGESNTQITAKFVKGERYAVRVRVHYAKPQLGIAIVVE